MQWKNNTRGFLILIILISLKFVIQYSLIHPQYELHRDEFLHLDQAHHLAWGYTSVPPATSWISLLILKLGNGVFWVKFFPALFGALTMWLVWKSVEKLNGDLFARILGATCVMFSVMFRINTLYQPNSLDILCWTLMGYCVLNYVKSQESKWFYLIALSFSMGFLNKYNIVFLLAGLVPALLLTDMIKVFKNKHLYISIGLAFVLILPNLIWQYENGFPVLTHMRELTAMQLVNVQRWDFVRQQFLFFPGTFMFIIAGLFALTKFSDFQPYRIFFWAFFITMGIFILLRAKGYYAIGIYPIFFAFGSVFISTFLRNSIGKVLKPILIIWVLVSFLPLYLIAFPNKNPEYIVHHQEIYKKFGMLTWEDGKQYTLPQDFADMLGWKELAEKVDSVYHISPSPLNTLVLCDNYGLAGAINYYSLEGVKAVSFNADYIHWMDLETPYHHLILIKENDDDLLEEMKNYSPYFDQAMIADSITHPYAREHGSTILAFWGAHLNINDVLKKEAELYLKSRSN